MKARAGADIGRAQRAVKAEMHIAAGPQQRKQFAPALRRIREMVQYAARLDQFEASSDGVELEDVGLRVFDIVQPSRASCATHS